ncbi:MAG: hypothetical protein ACQES9_01945 [Myxococcota bacterium]
MASKLSSYIVKKDLIPIKKLDKIFQRQVLQNISLDTILLDMGILDEVSIVELISKVSGLKTIQLNSFEIKNKEKIAKVFPKKLVKRYSVVPVIKKNDFIGVLVTSEVNLENLEEMGFMLGVTLVPRVVPEIRLFEIADQIYGFGLNKNISKVLAKAGACPKYPEELVSPWNFELSHNEIEKNSVVTSGITEEPQTSVEVTPVPHFEYVEREIPSDILVDTIQNTQLDKLSSKISQKREKTSPDDELSQKDDYEFDDIITKPGFVSPNKNGDKTKIKDIVNGDTDYDNWEFEDVPTDIREIEEQSGLKNIKKRKQPVVSGNAETGVNLEQIPTSKPEETIENNNITNDNTPIPEYIEEQNSNKIEKTKKMGSPSSEPEIDESDSIASFDASPLSLSDLGLNIMDSKNKQEILVNFLRFGANYCEYLYLFFFSGNAAQGKYAIYNQKLDQHSVREYLVSLEFESYLKNAYEQKFYCGPSNLTEGNLFLFDYLSLGQPENVVSIPVILGKRSVLCLFGVTNSQLPDNIQVQMERAAKFVSKGLLNLIKEKKMAKSLNSLKNIKNKRVKAKPIPKLSTPQPVEKTEDKTLPIDKQSKFKNGEYEETIAFFDQLEHSANNKSEVEIISKKLKENSQVTIEVLKFYFPGMITWQEDSPEAPLPPPHEHGPLLAFVIDWGLPAVPALLDLFDSESLKARFYAIYCFYELRLPEVLFRISEKLFDYSQKIRSIAAKVLLSYSGHEELDQIISNIREHLHNNDIFFQKCAIEALGQLRDRESVPVLLDKLHQEDHENEQSIQQSLRLLTLRDFGNKIDRWNSWWVVNKNRHRIRWIIESLRQSDRSLRVEAKKELIRLTGEDKGYDPDLKSSDMEKVIREWMSWWDEKGKTLYS